MPALNDVMKPSAGDAIKQWHAQLSSGFDQFLGYASTEINDRSKRKSDEPVRHDDRLTPRGTPRDDVSRTPRDDVSRRTPQQERSRSSSSESRGSSAHQRDRNAHARAGGRLGSVSPATAAVDGHRSRSRSPQRGGGGDGGEAVEDEAVLKCFKKKFYGKFMQSSGGSKNDGESTGAKYVHANFKPKGKDWKKNLPGHTLDSSQCAAADGKSNHDDDGVRSPSRPQSSSSHHSASLGADRSLSPSSARRRSPSPRDGHVRQGTPASLHHASSSPLSARSSGPPSRPASEAGHYSGMHSPFSRSQPPLGPSALMPSMHLDGGGGALDGAQLDAARLAHASPLFADYSRAAGAYNNTPRTADAKLSQAAAPSSGSDTRKSNATASDGQKHSFGGEPQIFNPLARHG